MCKVCEIIEVKFTIQNELCERFDISKKKSASLHSFLLFILVLTFRIHWEPTLPDALPLLKDFEDAPEARAADDTEDGAEGLILDKERATDEGNACEEEHPPAVSAEVILRLDDDGMKEADGEERHHGDDQAYKVHIL